MARASALAEASSPFFAPTRPKAEPSCQDYWNHRYETTLRKTLQVSRDFFNRGDNARHDFLSRHGEDGKAVRMMRLVPLSPGFAHVTQSAESEKVLPVQLSRPAPRENHEVTRARRVDLL